MYCLKIFLYLSITVYNIIYCSDSVKDPDVYLDVPGIISRYGYPSESHTIITDDGYILTLHRIPHGRHDYNVTKPRQPVFLQHGLMGDSCCFVLSKRKSLAFILADAGYDVWMNNVRGTRYSKRHIKYERKDYKYWDWSWEEIADYDVPKALKYVAVRTNQTGKILYIGYSMGTTVFFASMSSKPKNSKYVKAMFALAPVSYVADIKGPLKFISRFAHNIQWIYKSLGQGKLIPKKKILQLLSKYGCDHESNLKNICQNIIFNFVGFDPQQFNFTLLSSVLQHLPSPTSVRTVVHFAQGITSGKFQRYDFGAEENVKRYGTSIPPRYNVNKIRVPVSLYWGQNDWLSQKKDVDQLWFKLGKKGSYYEVPFDKFNHLDFLFANDVLQLLYNQLLNDLKQYS